MTQHPLIPLCRHLLYSVLFSENVQHEWTIRVMIVLVFEGIVVLGYHFQSILRPLVNLVLIQLQAYVNANQNDVRFLKVVIGSSTVLDESARCVDQMEGHGHETPVLRFDGCKHTHAELAAVICLIF